MVVAIADGAKWKAAGIPGGNKTTICHHIRTSYEGAALELVLAARRAKCSRFLPCDGFRYGSVVQVAMGEREWLVDSEESFMACYQATVDDTFRYAGILCGKDRAAAEDATQEAYFSLLRRVHADQVSAVTMAYLRLSVRHRFLDETKRRTRDQRRVELVLRRSEDEQHSADMCLLSNLTDRERAAMVLRYVDDLPVASVAKAMDISTRAAESLLARATRRLRGGESRRA